MILKNKLTAILVDDEQTAITSFSYLIREYKLPITIIGIANNVDEAKKLIELYKPEVVFLDIEMPKKNGFVLLEETSEEFYTIFITAYSEYAIKAFEVSAVDYLLKPIDPSRLQQAIEKVNLQQRSEKLKYDVLKENLKDERIEQLVLSFKNTKVVVKVQDIICIEAKQSYSNLYIRKGDGFEEIIYYRHLSYVMDLLKGHNQFFRSHRSWLVNLNLVKGYRKKDLKIELENDIQASVSRNIMKEFGEILKEKGK